MALLVFNIRPAAASDVRNMTDHELHRTPDGNSAIDTTKSHLNRIVLGPASQGEALKALYESGVQKPTAQAEAPYIQIVVGASAEFFRPDDPNKEGAYRPDRVEQFEQETLSWLKSTFGDDLVHASTHLDESTPHMHVLVAPTYLRAARTPGRKKRGETDDAFEARKREAAERPGVRTVGRRSNKLLSAPNSFMRLRQSLCAHLAPLGIEYGTDRAPTDPRPQTTRQHLKNENSFLRARNAYEEERGDEAEVHADINEARALDALNEAEDNERRVGELTAVIAEKTLAIAKAEKTLTEVREAVSALHAEKNALETLLAPMRASVVALNAFLAEQARPLLEHWRAALDAVRSVCLRPPPSRWGFDLRALAVAVAHPDGAGFVGREWSADPRRNLHDLERLDIEESRFHQRDALLQERKWPDLSGFGDLGLLADVEDAQAGDDGIVWPRTTSLPLRAHRAFLAVVVETFATALRKLDRTPASIPAEAKLAADMPDDVRRAIHTIKPGGPSGP